jgi:hypothetical protein
MEKKGMEGREKKAWCFVAGGVPAWADIAREGYASVKVFIGGALTVHQFEGTPSRRNGEEATRATATRFFLFVRGG